MRLNRVLLLAATINILIFALVITSCSGDDGKNGKNGTGCYVREDGPGKWNVFCGDSDEPEGVLQGTGDLNGTNGANGTDGTDGTYCTLGTQTTAGLSITCSNGTTGTLDACDAKNVGAQELLISCGTNIKINICGGIVFDVSKKACPALGDLIDAVETEGTCQDGKKYSTNTEYCGYASAAATAKRTKLTKCHYTISNGDQPNEGLARYVRTGLTGADVSEADKYGTKLKCIAAGGDAVTNFISTPGTEILDKCVFNQRNDKALYTSTDDCYNAGGDVINSGSWSTNGKCIFQGTNQYCRYTGPKLSHFPITSSERCAGATLNEGKWKGEYCGYLEKAAASSKSILKVQTGLCDDFDPDPTKLKNKGPNEDYFGAGYCTVTRDDKESGKTTFSDDFCGSGSKNKPNNLKWAKEYCGWTAPVMEADGITEKTPSRKEKVYADICDEGGGPQEAGYNKTNYCEVLFKDRFSGLTTVSTEPCGKSGMPNKNTWQGQYCGYKKNGDMQVYSGICDDNVGPSQNEYNAAEYCQTKKDGKTFLSTTVCDIGEDKRINEREWKGEYCGFEDAEATETSKLTGACGDETDKGPNSESFGGGYCQALDKKGNLEYTSAFCGESGKVNEGSWKGEYCGYESANSASADKVYTGACDLGGGPNADGFNAGYCRWTTETSIGTEFTDALCGTDKINEGEWKAEYCYADSKAAVCTGGRTPNTEKNSTDPFSVRCMFTNDPLVCSSSNLRFCDKDGCDDLGENYIWNEAAFECRELAEAAD
jgi:hypothetical protein